MARLFAMIVAAAVLVGVASGASLRASGRSHGCDQPEGSEIIDGPDCGQVSNVVPMYSTAADVGTVAGNAGAAVTNADTAADAVKVEKDRAEEIAGVLSEDDKEGVTRAAEDADKAAEAATAASTALATALETFKGTVSGSTMSGSDVTEADKVELNKLTDEAIAATKACHEAGARVVEKATEAQAKAMKDTGAASKLMQVVLDKAEPSLEEMADVAQKSKHAAEDMDAIIDKASDQEERLAAVEAASEEQAAVWEALKGSIEGDRTQLIEDKEAVEAEIEPLTAAADKLEEKIDPLRDDMATVDGGGSAIMSKPVDIANAQNAQDDANMALMKMKAKVERMIEGSRTMEKTIADAEEKLNWPAFVAHMKELGTPVS